MLLNERIREKWIQRLLDALLWMEKLGYLHGDITIRNTGVGRDNQLKLLFGFGLRNDHTWNRDYGGLGE